MKRALRGVEALVIARGNYIVLHSLSRFIFLFFWPFLGETKIDQEDELGESHTGRLGVDFWDRKREL